MTPLQVTSKWIGACMVWVVLGFQYKMLMEQWSVVQDYNMEAMDIPISTQYLLEARQDHQPALEYMKRTPEYQWLKDQAPEMAFHYQGERYQFEFFALQAPFLVICYLPFIKLMGLSNHVIAAYSLCYATLAWLMMGWFSRRHFGRGVTFWSMILLPSSLVWIIHTHVGYAAWMPSVCLMIGIGILLGEFIRDPKMYWMVLMGLCVACAYLTGWIVFVTSVLFAALGTLLLGPRNLKQQMVAQITWVTTLVVFSMGISILYSWIFRLPLLDIHSAIADVFVGRYSQGSVPGAHPTLATKLAYAFQCLFVDMKTFDHPDKFLEGNTALSRPCILFLWLGALYTMMKRRPADRILLIWMLSVMGLLVTLYLYAHRYVLLALPAFCVVAAVGICELAGNVHRLNAYGKYLSYSLFGLWIFISAVTTHGDFYSNYLHHKKENFEVDRIRGHSDVIRWFQDHGESLLVLNDPLSFPHTAYVFHLHGHFPDCVYWSHLFPAHTSVQTLIQWEKDQLEKHSKITYVFTTFMRGNPQTGEWMNDWRIFHQAHPEATPVHTYSYDGRSPQFAIYEISSPGSLTPAG